ncbi:DUF962 domain-containing protein [Bacillus sp. Marseille-P3661]|uniref:DUF962 domain-containing protein n=1 Tax=Bacillus sp. Marseille-P3661 TaxID=1936234 RepID=UPI000C8334DF|nr:DUF962 domain-containing protein [Bacillus sp. Marseille-P3661]
MNERLRNDLIRYQKAHQNKWNQVLHYFAFMFAFIAWIFLIINIYVTIYLALLHYAFSWFGHFYFEKNKPASFKQPVLGFYAGFLWFFLRNFELITRKKILPKIS